ncbi:MAG TPA: hypothetical protein VKU90_02355 [Caulobacteraceae bacterium]|nr:hypothetical protein [Caulobacteraceae bacterium]
MITDAVDADALAATFASLNTAATDGFVREVLVVGAEAATAAEEAGAIIASDLDAACAAARQPWLLILVAGARLEVGWEQAAWRHVREHPGRAGRFRLSLRGGPVARLEEARAELEAGLLGRPRPAHGLLRPRATPGGRPRRIGARVLA